MASTAAPPSLPPGSGLRRLLPRRRPLIYYGYWIVVAAFVSQFVHAGMQTYVDGVFFKPMTEELDWTRAEFTYAQTVGRFMTGIVAFMIGAYVDRFGGRRLMVIGTTMVGVGLFATAEVTALWQWVLLRGAIFTTGAALSGNLVVNVTLSKWFVEKRGRVVATAAIGISLAGVLVPPLLTLWVDTFGWRSGWQILGALAILLSYPVAMLMRRQPEDYGLHPDGHSDAQVAAGSGARAAADYANSLTRREALHTPAFYMVVLAFGLSGVALGNVLLQTIPFLTDEGFSRSAAALMLALFSLFSGSSKPFWGIAIDRFSPPRLSAASMILTALSLNVMVLGTSAHSVPIVMAAYVLFGLSVGGTLPLQEVIWASYFGRRYLGAVRSVAMPFSLLLGAGGPLAVSFYFDIVGSYHGAFVTMSGLSLLGAVVMMFARRPEKPASPPDDPPASPVPAIDRRLATPSVGREPVEAGGVGIEAGRDGGVRPHLLDESARPAAPPA